MALATELSRRGVVTTAVALSPSDGPSPLGLEALGPTPLGHGTLRALRVRAQAVRVVVAYGSKTLPACALALAGCRTPFVYRSIGDPSAWAGGRLRRMRTATLLRRAAHVVALSSRAGCQIERLYGVAPAAISVAPNARDDAVYVPPTAARAHECPSHARCRAAPAGGVPDRRADRREATSPGRRGRRVAPRRRARRRRRRPVPGRRRARSTALRRHLPRARRGA